MSERLISICYGAAGGLGVAALSGVDTAMLTAVFVTVALVTETIFGPRAGKDNA